MACFYPVKVSRSRERGESGRYGITFNPTKALVEGSSFSVPCGRCIGCRVSRNRAWALRCMHEAQMHTANSFVTLTYDDEHLPADYSVSVRELQLFMKRVRKHHGSGIRFFGCGEYGGRTFRPHYHALLFGLDFNDQVLWNKPKGRPNYTSAKLSKLWPFGLATVAPVNYTTAAYCAGYVLKKVTGEPAADHYTRVHPITGRLCRVHPEFATQSRSPGLGSTWFDKYKSDAFPSDFLIVDGRKVPVPVFYTRKLSEQEATPIKRRRVRNALKHKEDSTPARLRVREEVLQSKLKQKSRTYEDNQ